MASNQAKGNKEQGYDHLKSLYDGDPGLLSKNHQTLPLTKHQMTKSYMFDFSVQLEDASSEVGHFIK